MRERTWWLGLLVAVVMSAAAGPAEDGVAAYRAGQPAEAVRLLSQALAAKPDDLSSRYWRARGHTDLGQLEQAAADYQAILTAKPESTASRYGYAGVLERLGRFDDAVAEYRRVLRDEPSHAASQAALARLTLTWPRPTTLPTDGDEAVHAPRLAIDGAESMQPEGNGRRSRSDQPPVLPDADAPQLLDYTFSSAPTDWLPAGGQWAVSSRFACDPTWSFFGGHSLGLACVWNKRVFTGDLVVEAYVSFQHGLPWNSRIWSYRPADLCLTLFGDGRNPASGYSFVFAGQEGRVTQIRRGGEVLAETTEPAFVTPPYMDTRPDNDDFHRRWWRLEARRIGSRLTFLVDGQVALEVDDPEPIDAGQVALWTVRNGMMVARVRLAYEHELRPHTPAVRLAQPVALPTLNGTQTAGLTSDEPLTTAAR